MGVRQGSKLLILVCFFSVLHISCGSNTNSIFWFQGNFNHWRPLFLHFDTYFKAHISGRNDLLLADELLEDDAPFPKQAVLQILRVMQIILDNCHNKVSFSGLEV